MKVEYRLTVQWGFDRFSAYGTSQTFEDEAAARAAYAAALEDVRDLTKASLVRTISDVSTLESFEYKADETPSSAQPENK